MHPVVAHGLNFGKAPTIIIWQLRAKFLSGICRYNDIRLHVRTWAEIMLTVGRKVCNSDFPFVAVYMSAASPRFEDHCCCSVRS
jgi:hypothetical protein